MIFSIKNSWLILFFCCVPIFVHGQENCGQEALEEAQQDYTVGQFKQLTERLTPCLDEGFTIDEKIQAYRLLALSWLAQDDIDNASEMINQLLDIEPNWEANPIYDPPGFAKLVESLKRPVTSLVTASRQAESIQESPVPVTVITHKMIDLSGARNLKELLAMYVPGMTAVEDQNEMNVSMRGVYGSSQQTILIMLNGHRLNNRAYAEADPNYSMTLDKVRQIEILRGPASSLYGNVALTSVINIITYDGQDINGFRVNAGLGNYGQAKANILYGTQFNRETNLLIWGNYYRSEGEKVFIPKEEDYSPNPKEGNAIIMGIKDKPSYDVGMTFKTRNLFVMGNVRYCKYIEPFTSGGITGEVYDYDKYRTMLGTGPGLGSGSSHAELQYDKKLNKGYKILANGYLDLNHIDVSLVTNPEKGQSGKVYWNEYAYGGIFQVIKDYNLKKTGKGNILMGTQMDQMHLIDSYFILGVNGQFDTTMDNSNTLILDKGSETIYSGFIQLKQYIGKKFIVNVGGRYDYKNRHKGSDISNFAPRLSLIYIPVKTIDVKISYAQSFVDAPYWYRYNSLPSYKGAENLLPEYMNSLQLTSNLSFMDNQMNLGLNLFYNKLKDFIYRDPDATGDEPRYINAGRLNSTGIEADISYYSDVFRGEANLCWQYAIDAEDYGVTKNNIDNVPSFTGNIILNVNPFYKRIDNLWLNLTIRYIGNQYSPINTYKNGEPYFAPLNQVSGVSLFNLGFRLSDFHNFTFDARFYNIFNTYHTQGGSVNFPYPQQGMWFMVQLGYRF